MTTQRRARPPARHRRRRRHRARLDDRRRRLLGVRARPRPPPAAALLIGLALAAGVAYCNAVASAQLAAQYPTSGGTYVYGRERLGEWWGFLAGWGFVVGKTASCAAMALTFASYAVPGRAGCSGWSRSRPSSRSTAVNYRGITRTAGAGAGARRRLASLRCSWSSCAIAASGEVGTAAWPRRRLARAAACTASCRPPALLFFAFAGYARIATLGEEVRDPARTIPRAIPIALGDRGRALRSSSASRAAGGAGPDALAASTAPLATAVDAVGAAWARAGRPRRRRGREPRRAAGADRRRRADDAGDGAQRRPAALARRGRTRATGCPTAPSSRSAWSSACSC